MIYYYKIINMTNQINFDNIIKYIIKDNKDFYDIEKFCKDDDLKNFKKKIKDFKSNDIHKNCLKQNGFKKPYKSEDLFIKIKEYFKTLEKNETESEKEYSEEKKEELEEELEEEKEYSEGKKEELKEESEEEKEEIEEKENNEEENNKEEKEEELKEESEEEKESEVEEIEVEEEKLEEIQEKKEDIELEVESEESERKEHFKNTLKMFEDMTTPRHNKISKNDYDKVKDKFNSLIKDYKKILKHNNNESYKELTKYMISNLIELL